jgi:hypothetical protein
MEVGAVFLRVWFVRIHRSRRSRNIHGWGRIESAKNRPRRVELLFEQFGPVSAGLLVVDEVGLLSLNGI